MPVTGSDLLAEALQRQGVEAFFFLMGAPMLGAEKACIARGIKGVDVRHEQGAAMMAHAYARVASRAGVCMACSGPGALNFGMGLANALVDCAPVVAIGGSSPVREYGTGAFQEFDQVAALRPVTKWAERVYETRRIPEYVDIAFRKARSGKPGPVYLDLPGDVLQQSVDEASVTWPSAARRYATARSQGDAALVQQAIEILAQAERPVVLSGSGVLWSGAAETLRGFVERFGIPIYTTPQGRGVVPEDSALVYASARSTALKEADAVLVVGTRLNYVFNHGLPPRIHADAKIIRIDIDADEIGANQRVDVGILGDADAVVRQMHAAGAERIQASAFEGWRARLQAIETDKAAAQEIELANDALPIHPLRLCKEIRDFIDRDAVLVVDGQEILNYGRQSIPTFVAGHRLNSGPFGTMGVGVPFGVGAKAAKPGTQVVVLHGDGSFGMNGFEMDTAVRHGLPILVVISLNGGWTADPKGEKPGRALGYTRYDEMARVMGCHGEYVERPEDIRPALERAKQAMKEGKPAVVNVLTDYKARATTVRFSASNT
jgi:acetolactate synthase-1/2/3 large subunit